MSAQGLPTTDFWQTLLPADDPAGAAAAVFQGGWPARLPDGRILMLPLRPLPDRAGAVASLIVNHAGFAVVDALADVMAEQARAASANMVVGVPTLGLALAPEVARRIGLAHSTPLGYSRKFWYRDDLSEPVRSITSPGGGKRVYIDPNIAPRLAGCRVALVDDAISTGGTILAALTLLERLGCRPVAIIVAMRQGARWRDALAARDPALPGLVRGAVDSPLFERDADGWRPVADGAAGHAPQSPM